VDEGLVVFWTCFSVKHLKAINKMQAANDVELDSVVFQVSSADNR
jgi:hypothetical protein